MSYYTLSNQVLFRNVCGQGAGWWREALVTRDSLASNIVSQWK